MQAEVKDPSESGNEVDASRGWIPRFSLAFLFLAMTTVAIVFAVWKSWEPLPPTPVDPKLVVRKYRSLISSEGSVVVTIELKIIYDRTNSECFLDDLPFGEFSDPDRVVVHKDGYMGTRFTFGDDGQKVSRPSVTEGMRRRFDILNQLARENVQLDKLGYVVLTGEIDRSTRKKHEAILLKEKYQELRASFDSEKFDTVLRKKP